MGVAWGWTGVFGCGAHDTPLNKRVGVGNVVVVDSPWKFGSDSEPSIAGIEITASFDVFPILFKVPHGNKFLRGATGIWHVLNLVAALYGFNIGGGIRCSDISVTCIDGKTVCGPSHQVILGFTEPLSLTISSSGIPW